MSPSTATDANRSEPPGPVVTDAATQSDRIAAMTARIMRGVEPGGIKPQSLLPVRASCTAQTAPPAIRAAPPSQTPFANASAPNPIATTAIPSARPRRPSASVMTAAPAQATKAAAIVTRSSADRERQSD